MKKSDASSSELTLLEKASLLYGKGWWHISGYPKKGIPSFVMHDGPLGLRNVEEGADENMVKSVPATCFPSPALLACSWNPSLMEQIGKAVGYEAIDQDTNMVLAPGVNIKRNPLCGRNFEYLSEDPLLSGEMGSGYISGIQSVGVGACLKHFACNSQEYERMVSDSIVDEKALHEIYLKAFEIAIKKSKPWAVMASYNKVNGAYASENDYLLNDTLRDQWGYEGVVMSDWGATNDPVSSHNHGLDLEMPCAFDQRRLLVRALEHGRLSHDAFNASTDRILKMIEKSKKHASKKSGCHKESHDLSVKAVEESAVLLKNARNILPLSEKADICVIGSYAEKPRYQGNGSSHVCPKNLVSFLDACKEKGLNVPFAKGFGGEEKEIAYLRREAVHLAKEHKNVILFLGLSEEKESEGYDRVDMKMTKDQLDLFHAIYAVNHNIVVVLSCGSPVELPFNEDAKAILLTYLTGEAGGEAIYNILFGKTSPSGHLAETWPKRYLDVPNMDFYPGTNRQALYKESVFVGYRYFESAKREVLYPFGYGLSYAKFTYGPLVLNKDTLEKGSVTASIEVKNESDLEAAQVVQLYRKFAKSKMIRPLKELVAFQKVVVPAHGSKTVAFVVPYESFKTWDLESHSYQVEGGEYRLAVGVDSHKEIDSVPLKVISKFKTKTLKASLPHYYVLPAEKRMDVPVSEFETLLGHEIPKLGDRYSRPYTLESCPADLSKTWIGKKIVNGIEKRFPGDDASAKMAKEMALTCPIRSLGMGGLSPRVQLSLLDLANGKPLRALKHIIFGTGE